MVDTEVIFSRNLQRTFFFASVQRISKLKGWVSGFGVRVQGVLAIGVGFKSARKQQKAQEEKPQAFRSNNVRLKDCCLQAAVILAFSS